MNIAQVNEFRVAQGLVPLVAKDNRKQKRAQDANKAKRARESLDMKLNRASRSK